jgi:preprotein translocase subunit YajC
VNGFLILILIFGAVWLFFILPARRRRSSHTAMQETIEAGDDVITAGGIHGSVREVVDDLIHLEIAPGVVVEVDRRAIAAVAREVEVEVEPEPEDEPEDEPAPEPEAQPEPDAEPVPAPEAGAEAGKSARGTTEEPG